MQVKSIDRTCDVDKVKTEPVEVDDFKDANEALENQVKVFNDEKVN